MNIQFISVQLLSHVQLFATPWITAPQASLSITNSWSLCKTHVHLVGDAIQPSHPLSSRSPPALNLSQTSGSFPISQLLTWGGQSIGSSASTSIFPMNIQAWFPLGLTGLISLQLKSLLQHLVQKYHFFSAQFSLWAKSHIHTYLLEKS